MLGGGPFPNKPLKWLERTNDITKIYFDAPDGINFYWRDRTGTAGGDDARQPRAARTAISSSPSSSPIR